jgi:transposase InsO family protein
VQHEARWRLLRQRGGGSFFASLKKECLSRVHFATLTEACDTIAGYIDGFYNPVRGHSALGCLSPINYELAWNRRVQAA